MRVRKLLEGEEIEDRIPSQFLRQLKYPADTSDNEFFLQNLWITRLQVECTKSGPKKAEFLRFHRTVR